MTEQVTTTCGRLLQRLVGRPFSCAAYGFKRTYPKVPRCCVALLGLKKVSKTRPTESRRIANKKGCALAGKRSATVRPEEWTSVRVDDPPGDESTRPAEAVTSSQVPMGRGVAIGKWRSMSKGLVLTQRSNSLGSSQRTSRKTPDGRVTHRASTTSVVIGSGPQPEVLFAGASHADVVSQSPMAASWRHMRSAQL